MGINDRISKIKKFVSRYERHLSSSALIGGFIFDILVLTRIDMPTENLWIIAHLLIAFLGIVVLNIYEKKEKDKGKGHYWLVITIQFAFGGLLSTFLVFYFRSATISASWPFLLLLLIAFASNEIFKEQYARITFQLSYFFLSVFSFAIYYLPIILGELGPKIFILSGLLSIAVMILFLVVLLFVNAEVIRQRQMPILWSMSGIFIIFNILYFTNIIPPIPLSLKEAGVFHSITKNEDGDYNVLHEIGEWRDFFRFNEIYHYVPGSSLYVYSAVFSPTNLDTNIIHEWQYYDDWNSKWITNTRVKLPVFGGRGGGYRTYSLSEYIFPGIWRVNVETLEGQIIGRIEFKIEETEILPELISEIKT